MNLSPDILLFIPVLLLCLTVHEFAHAWSAKMGGDMTATYQGRLTLNPIAHIDPIGTVLMPILALLASGIPMICWAKPVPVNTMRLRSAVWHVYVSLAGPASNILLLIVTVLLAKIVMMSGGPAAQIAFSQSMSGAGTGPLGIFFDIAQKMIVMNLVLAIFNMIPIPPLDGSSLVYHFFIRERWNLHQMWAVLSQFGFIILFVLIQIPLFRQALAAAYSLPYYHIMIWLAGV
ncbi:MAG: site-2 protease family protein [Candidatus Sumerlaeaceae bacterium]|nr:site-2 protease family protein [Candidatus Sumerlaeaceae bacterium]